MIFKPLRIGKWILRKDRPHIFGQTVETAPHIKRHRRQSYMHIEADHRSGRRLDSPSLHFDAPISPLRSTADMWHPSGWPVPHRRSSCARRAARLPRPSQCWKVQDQFVSRVTSQVTSSLPRCRKPFHLLCLWPEKYGLLIFRPDSINETEKHPAVERFRFVLSDLSDKPWQTMEILLKSGNAAKPRSTQSGDITSDFTGPSSVRHAH